MSKDSGASPATEHTERAIRVLLVEDRDTDAKLIRRALERSGRRYQVLHVETVDRAGELLAQEPIDVVLTDLNIVESRGLDTYRAVKNIAPSVPIVVISGLEDESVAVAAVRAGAQDYVLKGDYVAMGLSRALLYAIDRQRLQEQLRSAQKLEAIGQVAGGIAHDFNNVLTIARLTATMAGRAGDLQRVQELLPSLLQALDRGAALTSQLLALSDAQATELRTIDLNQVIISVVPLLRGTLEPTQLELELGEDLPSGEADASMLEKMLLALSVRARAMIQVGASLLLRIDRVWLSANAAAELHPAATAGNFLRLSLLARGGGGAQTLPTGLWDPFAAGSGDPMAGFGLLSVHAMARHQLGWAAAQTADAFGACFDIYLPCSGVAETVAPLQSQPSVVSSGEVCVLVVDDEPAVRALAALVLADEGFRTIVAASGEDAIRVIDDATQRVDVVLTDMTMPGGMSGRELVQHANRVAPRLPVILSSGYSPDMAAGDLELVPGSNFLSKPYAAEELVAIVRAASGTRAASR